MATGILSVAAARQGLALLSAVLLAIGCAAWVCGAAALLLRRPLVRRPQMQSFAVVAATAVLGARFLLAGEDFVPLTLWALAALSWLALLLHAPALGEPSGGSLLVVVSTESLAVLAALLAPRWTVVLLFVAIVVWGLGLAVYPFVVGSIFLAIRRRRHFAPDHWILMGALAIATLAGTEILLQARTLYAPFDLGIWLPKADLGLWSLATALLVPLLFAELRTRADWRYSHRRWSFVFPLGMYAVASHSLARADGLPALTWVGDAFFAAAVTAWTLAAFGLARRAVRALDPARCRGWRPLSRR